MEQVVEALRLHFPMGSLNLSFSSSIRPHYGIGIDSASNRNKYQAYHLGVKAAVA